MATTLQHTKSESLVSIVDVAASDTNSRESHLVRQLYGVVAVLKLFHVATHGLVRWPVHLVPVHNAWLDLVE